MLTLLAFGTVWFWVSAIAFCIFCMHAVAYEAPGRATVGLTVFVVLYYVLGGGLDAGIDVFDFIAEHAIEGTVLLASYLGVGALWSLIKWMFFLKNMKNAYADARHDYLKSHNLPSGPSDPMPDAKKDHWSSRRIETHRGHVFFPSDLTDLQLRSHRSRIMIWIGYWPLSALWTLVDDPLRAMVREIYERLSGIFAALARWILGDIALADVKESKDAK